MSAIRQIGTLAKRLPPRCHRPKGTESPRYCSRSRRTFWSRTATYDRPFSPTGAGEDSEAGAQGMRRFRWVRVVVVFGLAGALVGVAPGVSAVAGRCRCRATAFVSNAGSGSVSTIDVTTRTKNPTDIPVGPFPVGLAFTPDGKTAFVTNRGIGVGTGSVSTIDVDTRTKNPTDITVGETPAGVAVTPDNKTAFVENADSGTVSTIQVKTRTKNPNDITVGFGAAGLAITPDG